MIAKYDTIGNEYNQTRKPDKVLVANLLRHLEPNEDGRYLDIGCGTGNYTIQLQQKGFQFIGIDPTCTGSPVNSDGMIALSGFTAERYAIVTGSTYTGSVTTFGAATIIPSDGVIANNLANPSGAQTYTVRIFNSSDCYIDRTVTINEVTCCPTNICLPINVTIIRRIH